MKIQKYFFYLQGVKLKNSLRQHQFPLFLTIIQKRGTYCTKNFRLLYNHFLKTLI